MTQLTLVDLYNNMQYNGLTFFFSSFLIQYQLASLCDPPDYSSCNVAGGAATLEYTDKQYKAFTEKICRFRVVRKTLVYILHSFSIPAASWAQGHGVS